MLIQKIQTSIRSHFKKQRNPSQRIEIGEEADGILYLFRLSDDYRKKYNTVSNKSEAHSVKQRNPIYERRSLIRVNRKKENLVRRETDNTCTRIEHSYFNKKLRTMFQVSKIPKQSTRKVGPDLASFQHIQVPAL